MNNTKILKRKEEFEVGKRYKQTHWREDYQYVIIKALEETYFVYNNGKGESGTFGYELGWVELNEKAINDELIKEVNKCSMIVLDYISRLENDRELMFRKGWEDASKTLSTPTLLLNNSHTLLLKFKEYCDKNKGLDNYYMVNTFIAEQINLISNEK